MLSKSIKVLSYSALISVSLMGNITTPVSYFDEGESFSAVSSHLLTGWGFSFNKANAACEVSEECIEIYGTPPEEEPWTGTSEPDPQPTDPDGGDQGGGSGGSGGGSTVTTEEFIAICKAEVDQLVNTCKATYSSYQTGLNNLCGLLAFGTSIAGGVTTTVCVNSVSELTRRANTWCSVQGNIKKENECHQ